MPNQIEKNNIMEVTEIVVNWLRESNVLKFPTTYQNNRVYLNEKDAQAFESGLRFVPLIHRIYKAVNGSEQTNSPELDSLKDAGSSAEKLYNWNIIIKALSVVNFEIDSDMKSLIIAGDRQIVAEILKSMQSLQTKYLTVSPTSTLSKKKKNNKLLGEGALLLDELDVSMSLDDSQNTLEFLILSFCKVFKINTKTAAGLLMQQGKFLAQILAKGLKGKSEPIYEWFDLLMQNSGKIADLIEKEKNSGALQLVLGSIKNGISSKDFRIVQKCCESLSKIHSDLLVKNINAWDWFSEEVYNLAFKSYDLFKEDVTTYILDLFIAFGKNNLKEIFGEKLIKTYPEPVQCFNVISSFWGYINEESQAYINIQQQGLVDFWVELGLREAENDPGSITTSKISALGFLCDVWCKFSKYIEQHEDSANSILTVIKRACREKSKILKVICYGRLFLLLSEFSKNKNSYAPILYKTLTFALVENYNNDRVREFLLNNFLTVMEEIQNLPISVMLEPYIKQTQVSVKPRHNTSDFDFYVAVARHSKLTVTDAIIVVDNLGKIYLNDYIFANSAEIPLILIFGRFIEFKPIQEYIQKFLQIGLKIIYSKLPKPKILIRESLTKEEHEEEKILSYYKKLVFSLTEKIIHLGNPSMNRSLKELLIQACIEVKNLTGGSLKGLKMILDLLGDSSTMIEKYEARSIDGSSRGHSISNSNANSYTSYSIISLNEMKKRKMSVGSRHERALSDIERIKQLRREKEHREKSQSELWRIKEEKQKSVLKQKLEQRKILLGVGNKLDIDGPIVVKDLVMNDFPFYPIEEETKADQELIWILIKKYKRIFRTLFMHYASSGYKKDNFSVKTSFESILDKKTTISEGEILKMLREHGVSNSFITNEELRKVIIWFLQKNKIKGIEYDYFSQLIFYISEFIFTKSPCNYSQFPPGISLMALIDQFKKSPSKVLKSSQFEDPDHGLGDKDVISMIKEKLKTNPDMILPEGYQKMQEKAVKIEYKVPEALQISVAFKNSLEILDEIINSALKFHFLSPILSITTVWTIKGILIKPQIELEDKIKSGIPQNKATYKAQPLPTYLNFTPGIKLEIAKLATKVNNEILLECARLVDDLIHTVNSNSFEIISRNPKPAGSIPNKVIQQKNIEEAIADANFQKKEEKRKIKQKMLQEKVKELRALKRNREKEIEEEKNREKELEEMRKKQKLDNREKEKNEIEKKIKEFKEKKEVEKKSGNEEDYAKIEERKKKEREEFLRQAKKKLIDAMNQKREKMRKNSESSESNLKNSEKKEKRKQMIKKLQKNKDAIDQERSQKEQVYTAMVDPGVKEILALYSSGIDSIFQYFCKMFPVQNNESLLMSLGSFTKFVTQFPIVPTFFTSDESVRMYKAITKTKSTENGINSSEFREILVNIAVNSVKVLENELKRKLETYGEVMIEFLQWIRMPKDNKKAGDFVKKLNDLPSNLNPRDKKRNKNSMIKKLSEN